MASVLELVLVSLFPVCILRPNLVMVLCMILTPSMASSRELNRAAQSSTYISMCMNKDRLECVECEWLVREPVWCGEW